MIFKNKKSLAFNIIMADIIFTYFIPWCLSIFDSDQYGYYIHKELNGWSIYVLLTTFLTLSFLVLFASSLGRKLLFTISRFIPDFSNFKWPLLLGYLLFSILFVLKGENVNRYDGISAAESLSPAILVVFASKVIFSTYLFYLLVTKDKLSSGNRLSLSLILFCFLLTIDGMAQMGLVLIVISMLFFYRNTHSFLFGSINPIKIIGYLFIPIGLAIVLFFGTSFKLGGIEEGLSYFQDGGEKIFYWLQGRISTIYYSLNAATFVSLSEGGKEAWQIVLSNFNYRLCVISGMDSCAELKSEYSQISHWNYHNITENSPLLEKSVGASPGILGASAYLVPLPLAGVIAGCYYYLIYIAIHSAIFAYKNKPASILGFIILLYLLRTVTLNPADSLIVISKSFISFVLFYWVSLSFIRKNRRYQKLSHLFLHADKKVI